MGKESTGQAWRGFTWKNLEVSYITSATILWPRIRLMAALNQKGHLPLSSSWIPRRKQTTWILGSINSLCHNRQELCGRNYKMLLKDINHPGCCSQWLLFLTLGNSFQMFSAPSMSFTRLAWSAGPLPPPSIPWGSNVFHLPYNHIHIPKWSRGLGLESGQEVSSRGRE